MERLKDTGVNFVARRNCGDTISEISSSARFSLDLTYTLYILRVFVRRWIRSTLLDVGCYIEIDLIFRENASRREVEQTSRENVLPRRLTRRNEKEEKGIEIFRGSEFSRANHANSFPARSMHDRAHTYVYVCTRVHACTRERKKREREGRGRVNEFPLFFREFDSCWRFILTFPASPRKLGR